MATVPSHFQPLPLLSSKSNSGRESCMHENIVAIYASEIIEKSFPIVKVSRLVQLKFKSLVDGFGAVDQDTRKNFCFLKKTDGFMPSGTTFARDVQKTDLCQTFNYWFSYRDVHRGYEFSRNPLYAAVSDCEVELHNITQAIVNEMALHYGYRHPLLIRDDSYVQFNMYPASLKRPDRKYLQEIHEDGHIITYVKPNAPGLLIYAQGKEQLINLEVDEAIVMAGSLLTELTDGQVLPLYHAVLDLNLPAARASLIYNVNALCESVPSVSGRSIPMRAIANRHHAEFGQYPYHSV